MPNWNVQFNLNLQVNDRRIIQDLARIHASI